MNIAQRRMGRKLPYKLQFGRPFTHFYSFFWLWLTGLYSCLTPQTGASFPFFSGYTYIRNKNKLGADLHCIYSQSHIISTHIYHAFENEALAKPNTPSRANHQESRKNTQHSSSAVAANTARRCFFRDRAGRAIT